MRFKKGGKVEVRTITEDPLSSWRCAEIIDGNGHNYTVRYDGFMGSPNDAVVERVPRKAIRPCPPPVISENWVPGDVAEVYDNFSWKTATVLKVLRKEYYLVRLAGSTDEIKVHKFDIRVKQVWENEKWAVVGKGSGDCKDGRSAKNLTLKYNQNSSSWLINARVKCHVKNDRLPYNYAPESQYIPTRALKRRSPYGCAQVEACTGPAQKYRISREDAKSYKAAAVNLSLFPDQVGAVAYPHVMLGEKYKNAANNGRPAFFDMDVERREGPGAAGFSFSLNRNSADDDTIASSVGSCSMNNDNYYKLPSVIPIKNSDDHLSDAESSCPLEFEEGNNLSPRKEELPVEVHNLELHAYRRTMEVLHAAGPLSWEREALLTDLRLVLNISNDEHLMEVRKLVSSGSSIAIS